MKTILSAVLLALISFSVSAGNTNYYGVVTRISFLDNQGSFVVTVDSNMFVDCRYKYAYFMVDKIGQERVKMAYSMTLTSLTAKMKMNFVIDKQNKGSADECYVTGMAAGIQSY